MMMRSLIFSLLFCFIALNAIGQYKDILDEDGNINKRYQKLIDEEYGRLHPTFNLPRYQVGVFLGSSSAIDSEYGISADFSPLDKFNIGLIAGYNRPELVRSNTISILKNQGAFGILEVERIFTRKYKRFAWILGGGFAYHRGAVEGLFEARFGDLRVLRNMPFNATMNFSAPFVKVGFAGDFKSVIVELTLRMGRYQHTVNRSKLGDTGDERFPRIFNIENDDTNFYQGLGLSISIPL